MENLLLAGRGIIGMPKVPDLIRSKGVVKVDRGLGVQEVVFTGPVMQARLSLVFDHDLYWVTSPTNLMYIGFTQAVIPQELNRIATLIELNIHNRTGSSSSYTWYLGNLSTGEVLKEAEDFEIVDRGANSWHLAIGVDKINEGDAIYFVIYGGTVGTAGNATSSGSISMTMTSITDARSFSEWMGVESI